MELTYYSVLVTYNNWNIIFFTNKITPIEYFNEIYNVVLDVICENMALMVQTGKYGSTSKIFSTKRAIIFTIYFQTM